MQPQLIFKGFTEGAVLPGQTRMKTVVEGTLQSVLRGYLAKGLYKKALEYEVEQV